MDGSGISNENKADSAYKLNWIHRALDTFERIPGTPLTKALLFALFLILLQNIFLWSEGALPLGTIHAGHTFIALLYPTLLALIPFLDREASRALSALEPMLDPTVYPFSLLRRRLTTLPVFPAIVAGGAGILFVVILNTFLGKPQSLAALTPYAISSALLNGMYVAIWGLFGIFIFHTIRQLRIIHDVITNHVRINVFNIHPLFAFSRVTGLTALSLSAILYGWVALTPEILTDPVSVAIVLGISAIGIAAFALPLLGAHSQLVWDQERKLERTNQRIEALITELHHRVDGVNLADMDDLYKTLASLELERSIVQQLPTWPWRGDMLRLLVTALGLPLGLWLIQFFLGKILNS